MSSPDPSLRLSHTDLSSLLRNGRRQAGLTQRELAARVGVNRSLIAKLESGNTATSQHLGAILAALNLDPSLLAATQPGNTLPPTNQVNPGKMNSIDAVWHEGVEYVMLKILKARPPDSGTTSDQAVQLPAAMFPTHIRQDQLDHLALAELPGAGWVLVNTNSPLIDGGNYLLRWRETFVAAVVTYTPHGYRVSRAAANDEMDRASFHREIAIVGRITGNWRIDSL